VEDRISGLKDKINIKEKAEKFLDKRLKHCKKYTQEFSDSIKGQNLQIMGSEEGEEVQANIFNKIIEKFPNLNPANLSFKIVGGIKVFMINRN
jgi:23S rRNA pseudoU1915 N3-methylase RlmH